MDRCGRTNLVFFFYFDFYVQTCEHETWVKSSFVNRSQVVNIQTCERRSSILNIFYQVCYKGSLGSDTRHSPSLFYPKNLQFNSFCYTHPLHIRKDSSKCAFWITITPTVKRGRLIALSCSAHLSNLNYLHFSLHSKRQGPCERSTFRVKIPWQEFGKWNTKFTNWFIKQKQLCQA